MEREGHDCSEWMSWSSFYRPAERYYLGVRVAKPVFQKLQAHLDDKLSRCKSHKGLYQSIEVAVHSSFDTIMALSDRVGFSFSRIPACDKAVWREIAAWLRERECAAPGAAVRNIRSMVDAQGYPLDGAELSFYDLLRLHGASCGNFNRQLDCNALHSEQFLLKDEVFAAMRAYGIPAPRAAHFAHRIAWGREELLPRDLAYRRIAGDNLWRKADCFHHVLTEYRVRWLAAQCPDARAQKTQTGGAEHGLFFQCGADERGGIGASRGVSQQGTI